MVVVGIFLIYEMKDFFFGGEGEGVNYLSVVGFYQCMFITRVFFIREMDEKSKEIETRKKYSRVLLVLVVYFRNQTQPSAFLSPLTKFNDEKENQNFRTFQNLLSNGIVIGVVLVSAFISFSSSLDLTIFWLM